MANRPFAQHRDDCDLRYRWMWDGLYLGTPFAVSESQAMVGPGASGLTLTRVGSPVIGPGGLYTPSSTDLISSNALPTASILRIPVNITLLWAVRLRAFVSDATGGAGVLFNNTNTSPFTSYWVSTLGAAGGIWAFDNAKGAFRQVNSGGSFPSSAGSHVIVGVTDASTDRVWVDGTLANTSATNSGATNGYSSTSFFQVAGSTGGSIHSAVSIWRNALTPAQIQRISKDPLAMYRWRRPRSYFFAAVKKSALILTPTGLDLALTLGTPKVADSSDPVGLDLGLAFGTTKAAASIDPAGLDLALAFGTPSDKAAIDPAGLDLGLVLGAPSVSAHSNPAGLDLSLGLGPPTIGAVIDAGGLDLGLAMGGARAATDQDAVGLDLAIAFGAPAPAFTIDVGGLDLLLGFGDAAAQSGTILDPVGLDLALSFGPVRIAAVAAPAGLDLLLTMGAAAVTHPSVASALTLFDRGAPALALTSRSAPSLRLIARDS
ncbi:MAG TPA: hypothetical protein VGM20_04290 [Gemmatimonadales bacterium]|jgi:hypothetical protein